MRTFVIGDIHGKIEALQQCFERSGFDVANDKLICLGDVCDRGANVLECIQLLDSIQNLIYIMGNHDYWTLTWLNGEFNTLNITSFQENHLWVNQGGTETKNSITKYGTTDEYKEFAKQFLMKAVPFHVEDYKLFIHGGIDPKSKAEDNSQYDLMWDRTLLKHARYAALESDPIVTQYDEVFIGHTPTLCYNTYLPLRYSNVWALDTGVCYNGALTIMNIKTKEYWQSDIQAESL